MRRQGLLVPPALGRRHLDAQHRAAPPPTSSSPSEIGASRPVLARRVLVPDPDWALDVPATAPDPLPAPDVDPDPVDVPATEVSDDPVDPDVVDADPLADVVEAEPVVFVVVELLPAVVVDDVVVAAADTPTPHRTCPMNRSPTANGP